MDKTINKYLETIKNSIKKNFKLILFFIIFLITCFIYNQNFQTLNYIFKRGTIIEYSINQNQKVNIEEINKKLNELKIKYSFCEARQTKKIKYDYDKKLTQKVIFIAIPYKINDKNKFLVDEISEFIFDKYQNSKLIDIKTLNETYTTPYNALIKFILITIFSVLMLYIILYLTTDNKKLNENLKENTKTFFKNQKESFIKLIKKTKEKGVCYLIKRILFDESESEKETDYTKEIISTILFVLICVITIRYFIGELRWIPSGSMRPTILEHDRVFVEKIDFPKKEIKRGDILVFYPPEVQLSNSPLAIFSRLSGIFCKDIAFIKRAIGLPGEKFEVKYDENINEYRVYINDKPLNEPYILSKQDWTYCNSQMYCGPFIIPQDNYFMMGDNRGNSQDSRFWGFLDKNRIIGRANFMFFPLKRINLLRDKYIELSKQKTQKGIEKEIYIINRY